jgi:hypothetical protein
MLIGAGSRGLSTRPTLPITEATSGKERSTASCCFMISTALVSEIALEVTGMNIRVPSSSGGMNSRPTPAARWESSHCWPLARRFAIRRAPPEPAAAAASKGSLTGASSRPAPPTSTRESRNTPPAPSRVIFAWRSASRGLARRRAGLPASAGCAAPDAPCPGSGRSREPGPRRRPPLGRATSCQSRSGSPGNVP